MMGYVSIERWIYTCESMVYFCDEFFEFLANLAHGQTLPLISRFVLNCFCYDFNKITRSDLQQHTVYQNKSNK